MKVGQKFVCLLLVLVMLGSIVSPAMAAESKTVSAALRQLRQFGDNFYKDYHGPGKEYIVKMGSGKYAVRFEGGVNDSTKAKIMKKIHEYERHRATGRIERLRELGHRIGVHISPQEVLLRGTGTKATHGDCWYFPSDDITICAGYEEKIKYWWFLKKHLIGQTHFVVYCNGPSFTDCDLEGWSAGKCLEGTRMDEIKLITTVSLSAIKPSISWPPSFTVSGTSGTLEDEFKGVSSAFHQYTDLHASDWIGFWRFEQRDDANFKKGNGALHVFTEVYFQ